MASVFTYDPDPPRISSPWANTPVSTPRLKPVQDHDHQSFGGLPAPAPLLLADSDVTKLIAEPQDGPIEYKLHLLLRQRRSLSSNSTGLVVSGSHQSKNRASNLHSGTVSPLAVRNSSGTPPQQSRQKRLEGLTTQLFWRLQQSSPYHANSTVKLVPPALLEAGSMLEQPVKTGRLLPGLEESRGALYEIGVSDDGVFVGLTKDEMDESLINLRSMATSLGCKVEILRTVIVGDCEWMETGTDAGVAVEIPRKEKSWVVEALVLPDTYSHSSRDAPLSPLEGKKGAAPLATAEYLPSQDADSHTEQLRVSLTGSTTSGKSSLVGTLSTSALDNGRGKARLSLLKHRHEIESGITSSVAPELIGYQDGDIGTEDGRAIHVVNYGFGNVSSWNDVHNAAEGGRLVFLVDSAGHPRFRRTTVRGLISWAPHWTMCCVAADDNENITGRPGATVSPEDVLGSTGAGIDLSKAHLELCLKLGLPLVVVITKLDIATNSGIRNTLSKVLSTVKAAGRNPIVLKPESASKTSEELQDIPQADLNEVQTVLAKHDNDGFVPIVFTSAVKGSGISKLHALLRLLPVPKEVGIPLGLNISTNESSIFHIDEIFSKAEPGTSDAGTDVFTKTPVLSGLLRHQNLEIGDNVLLGPFTLDTFEHAPRELGTARSYPSRLSSSPVTVLSQSDPHSRSNFLSPRSDANRRSISEHDTEAPTGKTSTMIVGEWISIRIISLRNLRLPLRKLLAGQVGTVGIEFLDKEEMETTASKIRKGMVLIKNGDLSKNGTMSESMMPVACTGLKAVFSEQDYVFMEPGAAFNIYVASIRASAKIISVETFDGATTDANASGKSLSVPSAMDEAIDEEGLFPLDDSIPPPEPIFSSSGRREVSYQPRVAPHIEVTFSFIGSREWLEVGTQVLVMPKVTVEGGVGLDVAVGRISEIVVPPAG